MAFNRARQI